MANETTRIENRIRAAARRGWAHPSNPAVYEAHRVLAHVADGSTAAPVLRIQSTGDWTITFNPSKEQ